MTIEYPLWMQQPTGVSGIGYAARLDRMLLAQLWDEGVMDLTAFKVTQRGAGANFSVDVAAGEAVVQGDDQTNQGNYMVRSTATENVVVTAAPGANSRYDLVCLRINDPNAGGAAGGTATIVVVAGTPAASPTVPATPVSAIALATIGPIATATASITTSLITDVRPLAGRRATAGSMEAQANTSAAIPNGWLLCAGQTVSRTTYARLFAHLGTTYGAGDGTTFGLPDLRGRIPVGLDNMGGSDAGRLAAANTLGGSGGSETHTLTASEMPVHDHDYSDPGHDHSGAYAAATEPLDINSSPTGSVASPVFGVDVNVNTTGITLNAAGSGAAHNNLQPYLLVNWIIRT